jgi:hypothetical protein
VKKLLDQFTGCIFSAHNQTIKVMTPFEQAVLQVEAGKLETPTVSTSKGNIDYFGYQLAVHKFNLSIMSKGMSCRGVKLRDLKNYYGLKGRTAADCLPQFEALVERYQARFQNN